jgi:hypothetical protein
LKLKVQIETLDEAWDIELKQDGNVYRLLMIRSKFHYRTDDPKVWHGQTELRAPILAIEQQLRLAHRHPHSPKPITILDGIQVNMHLQSGGAEIRLLIRDFEENTNEIQFMRKLLGLCNQSVDDPIIAELYADWLMPHR